MEGRAIQMHDTMLVDYLADRMRVFLRPRSQGRSFYETASVIENLQAPRQIGQRRKILQNNSFVAANRPELISDVETTGKKVAIFQGDYLRPARCAGTIAQNRQIIGTGPQRAIPPRAPSNEFAECRGCSDAIWCNS
jgi:hypothetical protein